MALFRFDRRAAVAAIVLMASSQGVFAAGGELAEKLPKGEACISTLMVALSDSKWNFYDLDSLNNRVAARQWDCHKSSDGYLIEAYARLKNYASSFDMDMRAVDDNFASISRYQASQQRPVSMPASPSSAERTSRSEQASVSSEQREILARLDRLQKNADREALMRSLQRLGDSFASQPAPYIAPQVMPIGSGGRDKETVICRNYGGIVRCQNGN